MLSVMIAPPNVAPPHTGRLVLPLLTPVTTVWGHVVVNLLMKLSAVPFSSVIRGPLICVYHLFKVNSPQVDLIQNTACPLKIWVATHAELQNNVGSTQNLAVVKKGFAHTNQKLMQKSKST